MPIECAQCASVWLSLAANLSLSDALNQHLQNFWNGFQLFGVDDAENFLSIKRDCLSKVSTNLKCLFV